MIVLLCLYRGDCLVLQRPRWDAQCPPLRNQSTAGHLTTHPCGTLRVHSLHVLWLVTNKATPNPLRCSPCRISLSELVTFLAHSADHGGLSDMMIRCVKVMLRFCLFLEFHTLVEKRSQHRFSCRSRHCTHLRGSMGVTPITRP